MAFLGILLGLVEFGHMKSSPSFLKSSLRCDLLVIRELDVSGFGVFHLLYASNVEGQAESYGSNRYCPFIRYVGRQHQPTRKLAFRAS
jgi:hypothetical protein